MIHPRGAPHFFTPEEETKKTAESRDENSFRVILIEFLREGSLDRALKFDLAETKFPPYSFLTRLIIPRPIGPGRSVDIPQPLSAPPASYSRRKRKKNDKQL